MVLSKYIIVELTSFYKISILHGIISKVYKIQGTNIINAITMGNNIVQQ